MKTFTVQCAMAQYQTTTLTVEAETKEAALAAAIDDANLDDGWEYADAYEPVFVEAVAEGEIDDIWGVREKHLAIPPAFLERHGVTRSGRDHLADTLMEAAAALRDLNAGFPWRELNTPWPDLQTAILKALDAANVDYDRDDLFPPDD